MDDFRVESNDLSFAPAPVDNKNTGDGKLSESLLRDLLSESLNQLVKSSLKGENRPGMLSEGETAARIFRVNNCKIRIQQAVNDGDSEEIIRIMGDLTPGELFDVVQDASQYLRSQGLSTIDFRLDPFDRIVVFDEQKNKGIAMAATGAYQRVCRFYDGSYRYGIELTFDCAVEETVDALFQQIYTQTHVA